MVDYFEEIPGHLIDVLTDVMSEDDAYEALSYYANVRTENDLDMSSNSDTTSDVDADMEEEYLYLPYIRRDIPDERNRNRERRMSC